MPFQNMDGEFPENGKEISGTASYDLLPSRITKRLRAMKAPYSVKRITFNPYEAKPGERLEVRVPKLNKNEVLVPGSLALRFDIDLSGGHANNYLVKNVSRACEPASSEVWGNDLGRHCGLRHIQDIHRLIFARGKAWKHGG